MWTVRVAPSAKEWRLTRTRCLRPSFRSTGRAPAKPLPSASLPPLISRKVPLSVICSCIWICLPTCPAQNLSEASVQRCKPCTTNHHNCELRQLAYFPAGLTKYVFIDFPKKSLANDVTRDDFSPRFQRLRVEKITGHQSVRDRDGVIAVMDETHWSGLCRTSG